MTKLLFQFSKYLLVGAINTILDFGVLNALMFGTGITAGIGYAVFKSVSVFTAFTNSYLLNTYWTFGVRDGFSSREFIKFSAVSASSFLLNVGIASFIVNVLPPPSGMSLLLWANIGAAVAAASAAIVNFFGYKFFVFGR